MEEPPPPSFIINVPFKYHRPEYVQAIATANGFRQIQSEARREDGSRRSEIWECPGERGWWFVRIDSQGHGYEHFGRRPHYHKDWVATTPQYQRYLRGYGDRAYSYADDGSLIGRINDPNDLEAKRAHIPR